MVLYLSLVRGQYRSSHPDVFLAKGVLKICRKFTREHPCRKVISIKLQSNFIEITLQHGCSPVDVLHYFRTSFLKNTYGGLLKNTQISTIPVQYHTSKFQSLLTTTFSHIQKHCLCP